MKRITEEPLVFPIGEKDYTVKPVGIDDGYRLADILNGNEKALKGVTNDVLFGLAMGDTYDEMRADGVALHLAFRAGLASLAHFRALTAGETFETAHAQAEAIWESGLDPKALEEWAARNMPTREPSTGGGGASTASSSGTSTRKGSTRSPSKKAASPSTTRSSSTSSSSQTSTVSSGSRSTTRRAR